MMMLTDNNVNNVITRKQVLLSFSFYTFLYLNKNKNN